VRIATTRDDTPDVRTLRLEFADAEVGRQFRWEAGQFGEFSVFGFGEAVFTLANAPTRPGYLEITTRAIGKLTGAIRKLSPGQVLGFRGPFGNRFPTEAWRGRDLVFVGGGIGTAALRSPLNTPDRRRTATGRAQAPERRRHGPGRDEEGVEAVDAARRPHSGPGWRDAGWTARWGCCRSSSARAPRTTASIVRARRSPTLDVWRLEKMATPDQGHDDGKQDEVRFRPCGRCNIGRLFVAGRPVFTWARFAPAKDF
jgi:hypothetical protein